MTQGLRRLTLLIGLSALLIGTLLVFEGFKPPSPRLVLEEIEHHSLEPGVEILKATLNRGSVRAGHFFILFAKPKRVQPILHINHHAQPMKQLGVDALLLTNAGFFTKENKATGLLLSDGKILAPFVPSGGGAGSGVVIIDDHQVMLWPRDRVTKETISNAQWAIQAGPRVIEPGGMPGIHSDDGARANRTIIGRDRRGHLAIAVIYNPDGGHAAGPTLFELQHVLGDQILGRYRQELAFDFALNLDGGPSTGLHLRHPKHPLDWPESTIVHSVLALRADHP